MKPRFSFCGVCITVKFIQEDPASFQGCTKMSLRARNILTAVHNTTLFKNAVPDVFFAGRGRSASVTSSDPPRPGALPSSTSSLPQLVVRAPCGRLSPYHRCEATSAAEGKVVVTPRLSASGGPPFVGEALLRGLDNDGAAWASGAAWRDGCGEVGWRKEICTAAQFHRASPPRSIITAAEQAALDRGIAQTCLLIPHTARCTARPPRAAGSRALAVRVQ